MTDSKPSHTPIGGRVLKISKDDRDLIINRFSDYVLCKEGILNNINEVKSSFKAVFKFLEYCYNAYLRDSYEFAETIDAIIVSCKDMKKVIDMKKNFTSDEMVTLFRILANIHLGFENMVKMSLYNTDPDFRNKVKRTTQDRLPNYDNNVTTLLTNYARHYSRLSEEYNELASGLNRMRKTRNSYHHIVPGVDYFLEFKPAITYMAYLGWIHNRILSAKNGYIKFICNQTGKLIVKATQPNDKLTKEITVMLTNKSILDAFDDITNLRTHHIRLKEMSEGNTYRLIFIPGMLTNGTDGTEFVETNPDWKFETDFVYQTGKRIELVHPKHKIPVIQSFPKITPPATPPTGQDEQTGKAGSDDFEDPGYIQSFTVLRNDTKEIPFKGGTYKGTVNAEGLPDGAGELIRTNMLIKGTFSNGIPSGQMSVKFDNGNVEFEYIGTLMEDFTPAEGRKVDISKSNRGVRVFEGTFQGWRIVKGKKSRSLDGAPCYEGEFGLGIQNSIVYDGIGTEYTDDFTYTGEFSKGVKSGYGHQTAKNGTEQYGIWVNDVFSRKVSKEEYDIHIYGEVQEPSKTNDASSASAGQANGNANGSSESGIARPNLIELVLPPEAFEFSVDGEILPVEVDHGSSSLTVGGNRTIVAEPVSARLKKMGIRFTYDVPNVEKKMLEWDLQSELEACPIRVEKKILYDNAEYQGEVNYKNLPDGNGKMIVGNTTFEGTFKNGKKEGKFIILEADGSITTGTYVNNRRDNFFETWKNNELIDRKKWSNGVVKKDEFSIL